MGALRMKGPGPPKAAQAGKKSRSCPLSYLEIDGGVSHGHSGHENGIEVGTHVDVAGALIQELGEAGRDGQGGGMRATSSNSALNNQIWSCIDDGKVAAALAKASHRVQ